MSEIWKSFWFLSSILVLTEMLFRVKKYLIEDNDETEKPDPKSMGLFFPDYALCCPFVYREDFHSKPLSFEAPEKICVRKHCKFTHFSIDVRNSSSYKKFVQLLYSAKNSVDICLWVFSLESVAKLCVYLHSKKKIVIRVIIDCREDETENSQISYLRERGICVRFGPQLVNYGMFHHKFAIIDDSILLYGSMNWTLSGIRKNMENVSVTSRPQIVIPFIRRFQYYWDTFSPQPTNQRNSIFITNKNQTNV